MPTARELLEQADALMRRNRMPAGEMPPRPVDIPVLTEVVEAPARFADAPSSPRRPADAKDGRAKQSDIEPPTPVLALDDVPVLTDVVEEIEAPTIAGSFDDDEPSQWEIERDRAAPVRAGEVPAVTATAADRDVKPSGTLDDSAAPAPDDSEARTAGDPSAAQSSDTSVVAPTQPDEVDELALDELEAPSAPPSGPTSATQPVASASTLATPREAPSPASGAADDDDEQWDALAEEIRMQVLQRIDMFTDTGLHEQLTVRLKPIVDRASADLVATINEQVRQLLRTYVAEAVEREIEKWRYGGG